MDLRERFAGAVVTFFVMTLLWYAGILFSGWKPEVGSTAVTLYIGWLASTSIAVALWFVGYSRY